MHHHNESSLNIPGEPVAPSCQPDLHRVRNTQLSDALKLERTAVSRTSLAKLGKPVKDWNEIKRRNHEITIARKKQLEGIESSEIFKATVEAKINEAGAHGRVWDNFRRCGVETVWVVCFGCGRATERHYDCNSRWCPRCNWRVTDRRRRDLEDMTNGLSDVLHVVLTQRNSTSITRKLVTKSRSNLLKLRHWHVTKRVIGGCASMEFTNEQRGWHLHWHLLLHSRFVCHNCLAFDWGRLVNQDYAIVKVIPVAEKSYVQEVCKYAVKGSEIAKWSGDNIVNFVNATEGIRMFSVFGSFIEQRRFVKAARETQTVQRRPCECGCDQITIGRTKAEALTRRTFQYLRS